MPTHYLRNFYYYMGWNYESENDKPSEEDVKKKQVLMKQINLSKLKMKKVEVKEYTPFNLQKIDNKIKELPLNMKPPKLKRETGEDYIITPNNTPTNTPTKVIHYKRGTRYNNNP